MRASNIPSPYEKLKDFTRGKTITKDAMLAFIDSLDLPADRKERLRQLSPHTYLGMAAQLAKKI